MKRHLGRIIALAAAALIVGTAALARTDWAGDRACDLARSRLPRALGMEVGLSRCRLDPMRGGIEVLGFWVAPKGAEEPLFAADRVLMRVRAVDLFGGRLVLDRVEAERPRFKLDLGAPPAPGPRKQGCFLDVLDRLEAGTVTLNGAAADISAPGDRRVRLDALDLDIRRSSNGYSVHLSTPSGRLQSGPIQLPVTRLRLSAQLEPDERRLSVESVELVAGELSASARGEVASLCDPVLGLEAQLTLPLDLVSAALPRAPQMAGNATISVKRLEGPVSSPAADVELTLSHARVNQFEVGDAWLHARVDQERLRLDRLDLPVGEGMAKVKGQIAFAPPYPVEAAVDLDEVEFARLVDRLGLRHVWVNFAATGKVEVKGTAVPFHLAGPASLEVRDFRVWDRAWERADRVTMLQFDGAHVDLSADFNPERVRLGAARVRTDRTDLTADASLLFDGAIDLETSFTRLDLGDLGHVAQLPWSGTLAGDASIKGPFQRMVIAGEVTGQDFRFHKLDIGAVEAQVRFSDMVLSFPRVLATVRGRSRFEAQGELDFRDPRGPIGRGHGSFTEARLSDLLEAIGDEFWMFDLVRRRMEARVSGEARVDSYLWGPNATIDVSFADTTYFERKLGDGRFRFRSEDGERVYIDELAFHGPCGELGLSGRVDMGQGMELSIKAPRLSASEWALPDAAGLEALGTLALEARLFGPPDHVRMEGTVQARGMGLFGVALGDGNLSLRLDRTALSLSGPLGGDLLLDARMLIEGALPFAAGVRATTGRIEHYLPSLGIRGSLTGEAFATGVVDRWRETRGDAWIPSMRLSRGDWTVQADTPVSLAFDSGAVELKSASFSGAGGTRLSASGMRESDGTLDLSLLGSFDARLLETFFGQWVEQVGGRVQMSASVAGSAAHPTVVGTAELSDGRLTVKGWPVSAKALRGTLEFSQNRLVFSEVDAALNGGRARLEGDIAMKDFSVQSYALELKLDEVPMRFWEELPGVFSGEVRLSGAPPALLVSGDVGVARLRYTRDVNVDVREWRNQRVEARSFAKRDEVARYDLGLHVVDARIDNNLAKATLSGDLRLVGTNVRMGLLGALSGQGGRGFFRGNEFTLTRTAVEFTERERVAPVLDVHAEGQVRDYRVFAHAWGPADDPQVDLTSDPELPRADVVTLLTLGFTSRDPAQYNASMGATLVSDALFSITGLDKRWRKFMPRNAILRDFNFQLSTQYSEVSGMVEPTAQVESLFLTDALKLRLSQPVISGRGRRAQAEYRFNEHVSAQAQWDNESSDYSVGDLGFDLKLRWELE